MRRVEHQESIEVADAIDKLTRRADPAGDDAREGPLSLHRIVVAIDGSESARQAITWTAELAAAFGSKVWLIHVLPPAVPATYFDSGYGIGESAAYLDTLAAQGKDLLDHAVVALAKDDVVAEPEMPSGHATAEIIRTAKEKRADLVILGSHGRDAIGRLVLGSVADGVKNHVRASVLIAKTFPPPERILVATDGSRASKRAAALAMRLRKAFAANMTILHVADMPLHGPPESGRKAFEAAFEGLDPVWNDRKIGFDVEFGRPAERIEERIRLEQSGLVVVGSRGLSPLKTLVTGSVSNRISHETNASVLIVREG
jgi:nucleotide-binding universal stress UspA family protein